VVLSRVPLPNGHNVWYIAEGACHAMSDSAPASLKPTERNERSWRMMDWEPLGPYGASARAVATTLAIILSKLRAVWDEAITGRN
jgi:hypothetical protein